MSNRMKWSQRAAPAHRGRSRSHSLLRGCHATFGITVLVICATCALVGTGQAADKPDASAIRDSAKAYVEAFDAGDAKAVAAMFTEDASLVDESGQPIKGREAIEKAYREHFRRNPGIRVNVEVTSIDFPADTVAVEDGITSSVTKLGVWSGPTRYTAVHVLSDGKWPMSNVHELPVPEVADENPLADLQWLVGKWRNKTDKTTIRTEIKWLTGGRFLQRDFKVDEDGVTTRSGVQIIGWNGQAGQICSWTFDFTGGHGMGRWTPTPDGYRIDSVGMFADGMPFSSTDFLIRVPGEDNVLGWRSVNRKAGATALPDMPELVLDRLQEKK